MQSLFGVDLPMPYVYVASLAITALLIAIFGLVLKRFKAISRSLNGSGAKNRQPRLGVVDTFSIDRQRQLVIVRRDNVEHLIMIGGTSDLLIESNIVRAASISQTLPKEVQQFVGRNRAKLRSTDDQPRSEPSTDVVSERDPALNYDQPEQNRAIQELQAVQTERRTNTASETAPLSTTPAPDQSRRIMAGTFHAARSTNLVSSASEAGQSSGNNKSFQPKFIDPKSPQPDSMPSMTSRSLPRTSQTMFSPSDEKSLNDGPRGSESLDDSLRRLLIRRPTNQPENN